MADNFDATTVSRIFVIVCSLKANTLPDSAQGNILTIRDFCG
jgi:hypothetical protein